MGKVRRKVIIRQSLVTYDDLLEIEKSVERDQSEPSQLFAAEIHIADQVFQVRKDFRGQPEFNESHIIGLIEAISVGGPLEPICVTPIGDKFYLVDGHHRYFAYLSCKWEREIPVKVFKGTLAQSEAKAGEENNKDKLPVSKQSKLEFAWTLTRRGGLSIAQLVQTSGRAEGTISEMRRKIRDIEGRGEHPWDYTWEGAKKMVPKSESFDRDSWIDEKSTALAQRICADTSLKVVKWPEVLVDAIEKISPELPRRLVELWHDLAEEVASFEVEYEDQDGETLDI